MIFHVNDCSFEFYCVVLWFKILIVGMVDLVFHTKGHGPTSRLQAAGERRPYPALTPTYRTSKRTSLFAFNGSQQVQVLGMYLVPCRVSHTSCPPLWTPHSISRPEPLLQHRITVHKMSATKLKPTLATAGGLQIAGDMTENNLSHVLAPYS
jgi:hypothetical protein